MSSVDSRIVSMRFDNSRFERGVAVTMGTLSKLKSALSFGKSKQSMQDLQSAADKFNMDGMAKAPGRVSAGFAAMATVAITALSNIVNKAVDAGLNIVKSLTVAPVMDGFREYETKMGSIQTILSNTSRHGTTLKDVEKNLDSLNTYADKTIYSFSDMTRNIGLFTNAGIGIEDSTSMIKGFSNEAAASGTNSQGAASAAYQLSQALSAGTIRLMDWRSLQNVGMGNKNMQNGLIEIADAMGTFEGTSMTAAKASDNFNASLEEKWLTADVMEKYLKIQAGDLTKAQMKNLGLTDKQADAFLKQQKIAEDAATKVRTFTQLIGTLQEAAGSGWAETFDIILGDFNTATELFTGVEQAIGGMLASQAKSRNKMLTEWSKLGGRDAIIEGIKNSWNGLIHVLGTIRKAFRDVFPKTTGKQLYQMSLWFRNLTRQFKMGGETTKNLRKTFRGFFSILSIGWQIVKGILSVIGNLFGLFFKGSGGILSVTGSIGDFFWNLDQGLKKNNTIQGFFDNIITAFEGVAVGVGTAVKGFAKFLDKINVFENTGKGIGLIIETLAGFFKGFGDVLGKAFSTGNFEPVLDLLSTGFLGAIALGLRKFIKQITDVNISDTLFGGVKESLGQLTETLKAMQTQLQAKTLMSIAIAVGVLAASLFVLSTIPSDKLTKALTAMAVGFGQMLVVMGLMLKMGGTLALVGQFSIMAVGLIGLAAAMLVLSAAMKVISTMSWTEIAKGLTGIAGALTILSVASKFLSKGAVGFLIASVAITAMSIALNLLAIAMMSFGSMKLGAIAKGLIAMGAALAVVAFGVKMMPKRLVLLAPALIAVAVAMNLLGTALRIFGGMDVVTMVTGLSAMGGALAIIAVAMKAMPKSMLTMSAGLLAVAVAMNVLAVAMQIFGNLSLAEIAKAFLAMGGALAILAVGLSAMSGSLLGSAALLLAAVAISALVPPLVALGQLSFKQITVGLLGLAAALTILGVAGYLINAAALTIVALGAGVALLGVGMLAAGAGVLFFAKGLRILVTLFKEGQSAMMGMVNAVLEILPKIFGALAKALVEFASAFIKNLPKFMELMAKFFAAVLTMIIEAIPKIVEVVGQLTSALLVFLAERVPQFIAVGFKLLTAFLQGLAQNIGRLTTLGITIVVRFLNAITRRMPQLVVAGTRLIISLLRGISQNIVRIVAEGARVILRFLAGLNQVMPRIVTAGMRVVVSVLNGIARNIGRLVTAGTNIIVKLLNGIARNMPRIVRAGTNIIVRMMQALGNSLWRVINAGANIIIKILNGIAKKMPQIIRAGTRVVTKFLGAISRSLWKVISMGSSIILRILRGLAQKMPKIVKAGADVIVNTLRGISRNLPRIIRAGSNVIISFLNGISREMPRITRAAFRTLITFIDGLTRAINENQQKLNKSANRLAKAIINGMIWGLKWNAGKVGDAAIKVAKDALKGAKNWLGINSPSKVFRDQVGKGISEGMAYGITDEGRMVDRATKDVAKSALDTARDTLTRLGSSMGGELDMTPTISPVLDLSNVRRDSKLLGGLMGSDPFTANTSYSGAAAVIRSRRSAEEASASVATPTESKIEFNQHNYSPKALSDGEIYRQTKNQLSTAKGALSI